MTDRLGRIRTAATETFEPAPSPAVVGAIADPPAMTVREKALALVEYGLADDYDDAFGQLVDMGEADEDDE